MKIGSINFVHVSLQEDEEFLVFIDDKVLFHKTDGC